MVRISPSSLTWTEGGANAASFNGHCWRFIKHTQDRRSQIDPLYGLTGAMHEHFHQRELENQGVSFEREKAFQIETDTFTISGRMDFRLPDSVDECKSSLKPLYLKDLPKIDHTYQLAFYMAQEQVQRGRLVYGRIQENQGGLLVRTQLETVDISITDGGDVLAGAVYTGFNVDSLMLSAAGLATALVSDVMPDRPIPRGFMGPCKYCPLAATCDRYDAGEINQDEFKAEVPSALANAKSTPAKMIKLKGTVNGKF
jgi:hypothetical protein